jgi:hypothetical protein
VQARKFTNILASVNIEKQKFSAKLCPNCRYGKGIYKGRTKIFMQNGKKQSGLGKGNFSSKIIRANLSRSCYLHENHRFVLEKMFEVTNGTFA